MRFNGEKLRELRLARKWDQHRLAEEARKYGAGITQASVSRHEGGMQPSGRNALAYARALDVDVREFYDGVNDEDTDRPTAREAAIHEAMRPLARVLAVQ